MPKPMLTLVPPDRVRHDGDSRRGDQRRKGRSAQDFSNAGAQSTMDILMAGLEPGRAVTDGEVDRVETLSDELRRFGEDVEAARA